MAVGIKGFTRKTGCACCFLFFRRPASTVVNPSCFSNRLKPQNLLQPAPSPVGEGWERAFSKLRQPSPIPQPLKIQALRLVALSLALSHGERGRAAVAIKGSARKTGCAGCFLLFRRPAINGCKSKLFFKLPATAKIAATCSLPRGGGLGRGHSPNSATFPNNSTTEIQALRLVALSLTLSYGERGSGGCWD